MPDDVSNRLLRKLIHTFGNFFFFFFFFLGGGGGADLHFLPNFTTKIPNFGGAPPALAPLHMSY